MGKLKHEYTHRLHSDHGAYGAWPPIHKVRIGDYGTLDGRLWRHAGNLSDIPHQFSADMLASESGSPGEADGVLHSRGASSFTFSAGAEVDKVVKARGGLKVEFRNENDFILNLAGAHHERLRNVKVVMDELVRRSQLPENEPKRWDHGAFCVVTSRVCAQNLTVVMAAESRSGVTLEAAGDVPNIDLANVDLKLQITSGNVAGQRWITKKAAPDDPFTPLFGMHKITWFWPGVGNIWWHTAEESPEGIAAARQTVGPSIENVGVVVGDLF